MTTYVWHKSIQVLYLQSTGEPDKIERRSLLDFDWKSHGLFHLARFAGLDLPGATRYG